MHKGSKSCNHYFSFKQTKALMDILKVVLYPLSIPLVIRAKLWEEAVQRDNAISQMPHTVEQIKKHVLDHVDHVMKMLGPEALKKLIVHLTAWGESRSTNRWCCQTSAQK